MNILLLTSHSIAEHDDLRMFAEMGYRVFSIGAYTDPAHPADDKRPPLPDVPYYSDLAAMVEGDQISHKSNLPDELCEWADVVIVHHFPAAAPDGRAGWITGNWDTFQRHGVRVVWRTCGQSDPMLEHIMGRYTGDGLQIVRYSPKETVIPNYAGADALIRFGKEPSEWCEWNGFDAVVGNITQNMADRGNACGYRFWAHATDGLPTRAAGPGSAILGGVGVLPYEQMRRYLRRVRCYLYTGTIPASYTLGLIEAQMTGTPIVSVSGTAWAQGVDWLYGLFEGHEITDLAADTPQEAADLLDTLLTDRTFAERVSVRQRARAVELFGMDAVKEQWRAFLED